MKRFVFLLLLSIPATVLAKTETTEWWVDGEVYATTSCETGADISVPASPTKKGYTFQGWETAVYDMSTLDTSINGTGSASYYVTDWKVLFPYGTVYGERVCSPTPSSDVSWYTIDYTLDTETEGQYCWCRIKEFIPTGSQIVYESLSSVWVYRSNKGSYAACRAYCAQECVSLVATDSNFRLKIFGQ